MPAAARLPSLLILPSLLPPPTVTTGEALFAGRPKLTVQTPVEAHMTKKKSGSSDGAQTYDTPIT